MPGLMVFGFASQRSQSGLLSTRDGSRALRLPSRVTFRQPTATVPRQPNVATHGGAGRDQRDRCRHRGLETKSECCDPGPCGSDDQGSRRAGAERVEHCRASRPHAYDDAGAEAAKLASYQNSTGTAFERAYASDQLTAHNNTIGIFSIGDRIRSKTQIIGFANENLPVLKAHLHLLSSSFPQAMTFPQARVTGAGRALVWR